MAKEKNIKAIDSLLRGEEPVKYQPPEDEEKDGDNTLRIVFGTSGTYPDGTPWDRDATPEEAAEYDSWMR